MPVTTIPKVGSLYHVGWGKSHGVVGKCIEVCTETRTVILKSPKSGIVWKRAVLWLELRHTRKYQSKHERTHPTPGHKLD